MIDLRFDDAALCHEGDSVSCRLQATISGSPYAKRGAIASLELDDVTCMLSDQTARDLRHALGQLLGEAEPAEPRWVQLEILGHREHWGRLTEVQVAGASFLKIEVPDGDGFQVHLYSPRAVFAIREVTEAECREENGEVDGDQEDATPETPLGAELDGFSGDGGLEP